MSMMKKMSTIRSMISIGSPNLALRCNWFWL